jgi:hypothetical protein
VRHTDIKAQFPLNLRNRPRVGGVGYIGAIPCGDRRALKKHLTHIEKRLEWLEDIMDDAFDVFDNDPGDEYRYSVHQVCGDESIKIADCRTLRAAERLCDYEDAMHEKACGEAILKIQEHRAKVVSILGRLAPSTEVRQ